jgi:predicted alpha/beta hydrolase
VSEIATFTAQQVRADARLEGLTVVVQPLLETLNREGRSLLLPLFGYFPGKRLRMVGDLPKGVMAEWARWCRSPHYICDERGEPIRAGFRRIRFPILSLSFTDDEMMSATNTARMHACYDQAAVELRRIAPEQIGVKRIGHFGFFRSQFRDTLWRQAVAWFDGQLGTGIRRANATS